MTDASKVWVSLPFGKSIRLFRIFNYQPTQYHKLLVVMWLSDLDAKPDYLVVSSELHSPESGEACSDERSVPIRVQYEGLEFDLEISRALYEALAALWKQQEQLGCPNPAIWAHNLSVSPRDPVERQQQNRIKNEIYTKASRIAVWLGTDEPDDSSHEVVWLHSGFGDARPSKNPNPEPVYEDQAIGVERLYFPDVYIYAPRFRYTSMSKLYTQRRYLGRVEATQEISIAARKLILFNHPAYRLCTRPHLDHFLNSMPLISMRLSENRRHPADLGGRREFSHVAYFKCTIDFRKDFKVWCRSSGKRRESFSAIEYLLTRMITRGAIDPRHHISKLLEVANSLTRVEETGGTLESDDTLPIAQLYTRLATEILSRPGEVTLLLRIGEDRITPTSSLTLPSWVPDFQSCGHLPDLWASEFSWEKKPWHYSAYGFHNHSRANQGLEFTSRRVDGGKLYLHGRRCFRVNESYYDTTSVPHHSSMDTPFDKALQQVVDFMTRVYVRSPRNKQPNTHAAWTAIYRNITLTAGVDHADDADVAELHHVHEAAWAVWLACAPERPQGVHMLDKSILRLIAVLHPHTMFVPALEACFVTRAEPFFNQNQQQVPHDLLCPDHEFCEGLLARTCRFLEIATSGPRYYFDSNYGYLGRSHAMTQAGDELWLLADSRVPFVLRPRGGGADGEYTLVSAAFVPGAMLGEFIEEGIAGPEVEIALV